MASSKENSVPVQALHKLIIDSKLRYSSNDNNTNPEATQKNNSLDSMPEFPAKPD
jgi:hypothetical protein